MFKKIFKAIKKYDTIIIARHIGVDPDALCSELALRDAIKLTFPNKTVLAVGTGSRKFSSFGKLDKLETRENSLLIVLDTPDLKRVDINEIEGFDYKIKIDHHPFVEEFCDLEYIDDKASSTCEIIMDFMEQMKIKCDSSIAQTLYMGLVSDSNRFLNNTCTRNTFRLVSKYLEMYSFDLKEVYDKLYMHPLNELRLEGYISLNMTVTENGLGYVKVTDDIIRKFKVDTASSGNLINKFNYIDEILVWATITEDLKNEQIRVSIRSRGPFINKIAEKYNGGGHQFASGTKVKTFEEAMCLMEDLDIALKKYHLEKEKETENK